jgi:two-component system, NtrC family, sensor histidine kinase HydH
MPIKLTRLKPKYLTILTICIVTLMVGSAYFEITSGRNEIFQLLDEEALSLVKTISVAGKNAILSGNEVESLVNSNLMAVGNVIKNQNQKINFNSPENKKLLESNRIVLITITDIYGNIKNSNKPVSPELKGQLRSLIKDFNYDKSTEFVPGVIQNNNSEIYFTAQKIANKKGYLFIGIDSKYFLEFRKKIGIGSLFRHLSDQKEIEYIVLQDEEGIIAASKNITELSPIQSDEFLGASIQKDSISTRTFSFNNKKVYEAVKPLIIDSEFFGIIRAGLSMESISSANERMIRRILITTIIIAGIGVVLLSLLMINQHKNTLQTELKTLQSYNEKILENMGDGVIAIDASGILLFINSSAEKILNIRSAEVIGRKTNEIFNKSEIEAIIKKGEDIKSIEITLHDPVEKVVRTGISFMTGNRNESDLLAILLLQDITEEMRLHKQLEMNEKMAAMGELTGGVAHEVRNPLNSISIIIQRLALEYEPKEDRDNYFILIKTIREEIARINKIIEQFLKLARKPKLNIVPENIKVILDKAINLISTEAISKKIKIIKNIPDDIILNVDSDQLLQALINVLNNAIQSIENSGTIHINLTKLQNETLMEIADNGTGIEKENLKKIFNLYYSSKPHGAGIGLSIVNQIVNEHNGRIEVESDIGKGTTFKIYLKNIFPLSS